MNRKFTVIALALALVLEYVGGRTLHDVIPPKGLPLVDVLGYAVEIAGALAAAHTAGILHRDDRTAQRYDVACGHELDVGLSGGNDDDEPGRDHRLEQARHHREHDGGCQASDN